MTPKLKKISITLLVLGVLFVLYAILKPSPDKISLTDGISAIKGSGESQEIGNQITQALNQINLISLDTSIFTNEIYVSLKDRSQQISDEPIGRPNPFAPIGDVSISTITASSSSAISSSTQANRVATSTPSRTSTSTVTR